MPHTAPTMSGGGGPGWGGYIVAMPWELYLRTGDTRQLAAAAEAAAEEAHLTGLAGQDAEDGLHQGALAGAGGAHQGRVGFGHQLEADVIHRRDGITPHAQVADFENHFGHRFTLPTGALADCRDPNLRATRMVSKALDPDPP
jgi:hypothetical protein